MSEVPKLYTRYQNCTQVPKSSLRQIIFGLKPSSSGVRFWTPVSGTFQGRLSRNRPQKMTKFGSRVQKTRFWGKRRIDDLRLFGHPRQTILGVNSHPFGRKMTPKTGQNKVKSVKKCLFFFRIVINFYQPQNFERFWSGISKICTRNEKTGSEFGISWPRPLEGLKTPENV